MRKNVVILGAVVAVIGTAIMLVAGLPLNLPAAYEQDSDKRISQLEKPTSGRLIFQSEHECMHATSIA